MENKEFKYTYSAPSESERKEIEKIKRQYDTMEKGENKLERLKRLDNKVKRFPQIIALTIGIIGTLVFGLGLTCALEWDAMIPCIVLSVVGIAILAIAYPIYNYTFKRNKKKYGEEILRLSKELLGE